MNQAWDRLRISAPIHSCPAVYSSMESLHYDKLIGEAESNREAAREWLDRQLLDEGGKTIEDVELEKSPRDLEIISLCEQSVSSFMRRYQRTKNIVLPMANIHVLKDGGVAQFTKGRLVEGAHSTALGSVIVDRKRSDLEFALRLFHELFHAKSYQAIQILGDGTVEQYRSGLTVTSRDGKESWFVDLDEAVIALMTQRFFEDVIVNDAAFSAEIENVGERLNFGRQKEVAQLNRLIDELWNKNRRAFAGRDEVERLFFEAQINGHLLKVARLIESTFGKGSFRRIGEPRKSGRKPPEGREG